MAGDADKVRQARLARLEDRELLLLDNPGVEKDDPMGEAGRKILAYHFERMLLNEPGSRRGEDIECVHDMRVATRRMRSALRVFEDVYKPGATKPIIAGLRRTGRALGAVRDMDVFIERIEAYQQSLDPEQAESLNSLLTACQSQQAAARENLITELDHKAFKKFVRTFAEFLQTPGTGVSKHDLTGPTAFRVKHIVPRLIYERYEVVRAYEDIIAGAPIETLHALRIEFKRLRYLLEFFREVLGPEAEQVIEETKIIQDHLGDMHDFEVAGAFLKQFTRIPKKVKGKKRRKAQQDLEQVVRYMELQAAQKQALIDTFPEAWARFNRDAIRRDLALAVSVL